VGRAPLGDLELVWEEDRDELILSALLACGLPLPDGIEPTNCPFEAHCGGRTGPSICAPAIDEGLPLCRGGGRATRHPPHPSPSPPSSEDNGQVGQHP